MDKLTIWCLQSHERGHQSSFWLSLNSYYNRLSLAVTSQCESNKDLIRSHFCLGLNQSSVCTVFCLHPSLLQWLWAHMNHWWMNWGHLNIWPWNMPLPTQRIYDPPKDGNLTPRPPLFVTVSLSGAYNILLKRDVILLYLLRLCIHKSGRWWGSWKRGCSTTIKFNDGVISVLSIEVSCG